MAKFTVNHFIDIAKNELGYCEKESDYMLDSKTANAGNKNYTKYGRDLTNKIGSPYGNGVAWCDMFVDWCIGQALDWDISRMKKALNGFSAYCPTSAEFYRRVNRFGNKPKVGAQFFTGQKGHEEHTGIVFEVVSNNVFKSIEGNYGNKVQSVTRYSSQCSGFGYPDFDDDNYIKTYDVNIQANTVKYGDYGPLVKTVQRIARCYLDDMTIKIDGDFGNITKSAVIRMQRDLGIMQDGVVGTETWHGIINDLG